MAQVIFTANIQRHLKCPPARAPGATVREVLDRVFVDNPDARDYILDNQGAGRQHMAVFVNGASVFDREQLSDAVDEDAEIYILQSLSGG